MKGSLELQSTLINPDRSHSAFCFAHTAKGELGKGEKGLDSHLCSFPEK